MDSSAWILALRKEGLEHVRRRADGLLEQDRLAICDLVSCELLGGARNRREFDRLERDLGALHKLAIDEEAWRRAGELNFRIAQTGRTVPVADCVIAAAAMRHGVILAHADDRLDWIAEETGLKVES
jgi:predicted nucleic acid-binding protein